MTYRFLEEEEWEKLQGVVFGNDKWIPHPKTSSVFVAEDADKKIVGFLVAQLMIHVEPMWVEDAKRGGPIAFTLWQGMIDFLKSSGVKAFQTMASDEKIGNYLERLGLKKLPYIPYGGEL